MRWRCGLGVVLGPSPAVRTPNGDCAEGLTGGEGVGTPYLRRTGFRYCELRPSGYGHLWGLLFTPVQIVSSSFGSDLPGPVSDEPPFVLSLLPTGAPAKVQLESGPAAVQVPPAAAHSCAGEAAYPTDEKTKMTAANTAIVLSATTNRFIPISPLAAVDAR